MVCIAGMENGLFSHSRSFDEPAQMEEERRLCYVGMTRAETRLFLTSAARRRIYGVEQNHPPSLFLVDIPLTCIQDYSSQPVLTVSRQPWLSPVQDAVPLQPLTAPAAARSGAAPALAYAIGTRVFHQHFGRPSATSSDLFGHAPVSPLPLGEG